MPAAQAIVDKLKKLRQFHASEAFAAAEGQLRLRLQAEQRALALSDELRRAEEELHAFSLRHVLKVGEQASGRSIGRAVWAEAARRDRLTAIRGRHRAAAAEAARLTDLERELRLKAYEAERGVVRMATVAEELGRSREND